MIRWQNNPHTAKLLGLIGLLLFFSPALAVNCAPDSITLSSQSEVNAFQDNHGPCDTIVGVLTISGADIADLSPLSGIVTADFGSQVLLQNNIALTNLDGLSGLASARWIEINDNPALTSISGLSSLGLVGGPLFIQNNASLDNLDGLEGITNLFQGALILRDNPNLVDLSGLSNLSSIAASLVIYDLDALTTLDDLSGLSSVASNISIIDNDVLASVGGLSGVSDFSAGLNVIDNTALGNLDGLPAFTNLNSLRISNNPVLMNVDGLSSLTTIANGGSALLIQNNSMLENLDGLAELVSLDADLEIINNPQLGQCSGLARLLDQTDDALAGPGPGAAGIPDVNGDVILVGNQSGCSSLEAILEPTSQPPADVNFIAGEAEFLIKGFAVTRSCLVSMIDLPGPAISLSPEMLLGCSGQNYADHDVLVFRPAESTCRTLHSRDSSMVAYTESITVPGTAFSGSLAEASNVFFQDGETAFLALNRRTSELTRVGTAECARPDLIFASGFE